MTTLRLYNTLTRQKEDFAPLDPNNVRLYVCGPTVYDYAHIGNARPVIVFDVLFRLLRHLYGEDHVRYVRNITDIDDKINARAAEIAAAKGVSVEAARVEITSATAKQYLDDVTALGCLPPTHTPRATEYVKQMIAMIEELVAAGHAYLAEGHVLFDVSSKADYGKLSRRPLDEMLAGARVEVAPYKKNPMDFVLWKPSDAQTPGWESPWGRGRPGWHIECSAMGEALLGETFDIHGGGIDLMFPHHENEIAQSEGAHHDHPLARVWMHNGFLQVEGEKMSKSLGNFVTIRELLRGWHGQSWSGGVVKLAMLRTHYRQPINWTLTALDQARVDLETWLLTASGGSTDSRWCEQVPSKPSDEMVEALSDDLNTPQAVSVLHHHNGLGRSGKQDAVAKLVGDLKFLGLFRANLLQAYIPVMSGWPGMSTERLLEAMPIARNLKVALINDDHELQAEIEEQLAKKGVRAKIFPSGRVILDVVESGPTESSDHILDMISARNAARKAKDFKESDRIRDELLAKGIVLKDGPNGTTWEVKR